MSTETFGCSLSVLSLRMLAIKSTVSALRQRSQTHSTEGAGPQWNEFDTYALRLRYVEKKLLNCNCIYFQEPRIEMPGKADFKNRGMRKHISIPAFSTFCVQTYLGHSTRYWSRGAVERNFT